MANYQSREDKYNKVQDPVNLNLINSVLAAKEGKYDQNLAQIDQSLAELGSIDSRLLRAEDREHLSNNIRGLVDQLNGSGKMDLSKSGITRNIKSQINSALDSTVINAVAQSTKISSFQAAIAEKQKSKPELYSDDNYQYALKKGGVEEYMSGKSDTVGNLNYDDYVNVPKVLDESIAKWAKDYGFHTEYSTSDPSQLIYTSEKKEVLTKNEIIGKLKSSMDPKVSKQLQIDSYTHYSRLPEGQINTDATNYYTKQNAEIDLQLVKIKASRTGETAAQKIINDNNEKYFTGLKTDNTKTLTDKNFDNDQQKYQIYSTNLLDGIADNYDKNETVEIKYIDNNLKIAQFNADIEYKQATLAQGQQRLDIAKQQAAAADVANTIASGGGPGSLTDVADQTAGARTDSQIATEKHNADYLGLKAALEGSSREYNELTTPAAKEQFIKDLASNKNSVSINNDTLTPEAREKLDSYKSSLNTFNKVGQISIKAIGESLVGRYNDILGGKAVLGNLSKTAPLTAKYAKSGTPLTSLSKQELAAVKHEMAVNMLNFDGGLSEEERKTLTSYATNLERQPYLSAQQAKNMRSKDKQEIGFGEGFGDQLSGIAGTAGNFFGEIFSQIGGAFSNNPNAFKEISDEYRAKNKENSAQIDRGSARQQLRAIDTGFFAAQDSNLTELEVGDLRKGAKEDASQAIRSSIKTATELGNLEYKKMAEGVKNYQGRSFNPEDKKQAPYTTALQTQLAAINDSPVVFEKGSSVSTVLSKDGASIDVTYILKGTTEKVMTSIPSANMPGLASQLKDNSGLFINSKLNKNAPARRMTYESPTDSKSREDLLYKLHSTYGETLFPEKAMLNQLRPGSSVKTQIELRAYGEGQPPEIASQIDEISTEPYDVVWTPSKLGNGWVGTVMDSKNNPQTEVRLDKDYNEGGMRSAAIDAINQVKMYKINQLIKA